MTQARAADALLETIERLRREGAARVDPVRFHAIEALARRASAQGAPVRQVLQDKLQASLADLAQRVASASSTRPGRGPDLQASESGLPDVAQLHQLNQHIRSVRPAGEPESSGELTSVHRFRRAWSGKRSQDHVEHAISRKPVNAGPINSHMLVLESLALMQDVSPDYLRRFLLHVEALQWLELAQVKPAKKAPRKGTGKRESA